MQFAFQVRFFFGKILSISSTIAFKGFMKPTSSKFKYWYRNTINNLAGFFCKSYNGRKFFSYFLYNFVQVSSGSIEPDPVTSFRNSSLMISYRNRTIHFSVNSEMFTYNTNSNYFTISQYRIVSIAENQDVCWRNFFVNIIYHHIGVL